MDDEYVEVAGAGDVEVYRRLDAFADARLAPDPVAMRRVRAHLMDAARARSEALGFDRPAVTPHLAPIATLPTAATPARRAAPRAAAALLAASLTLAVAAGTVAAAQAGGPLYDARVWAETLTLPATGDGRAEAQLARLDARLVEIESALAANDGPAAAAALEAFSQIMADLDAQLAADESGEEHVRENVSRHLAVLDGLVGTVPPQAQDALRHARERSDNALDHLNGTRPAGGNGSNPGNGQPNQPGTGPGSGNGQPGGPATDKPAKTPPAAHPTPKPAKTAKPPQAEPGGPPSDKPATTPDPAAKTPNPPKADPTPQLEPTQRPGRTPPDRTPRGGRPTP